MRSIPTGVAAGALAALVLGSCGDDSVPPEQCTGTCIEVANRSTLTVNEVRFGACGADWGGDRLSGEIAPGERRAWAVTPGCYDIGAEAPFNGQFCGFTEYGIDIPAGTTHVTEFPGCP